MMAFVGGNGEIVLEQQAFRAIMRAVGA